MSNRTVDCEMFTCRTAQIVRNLTDDEELAEGLDGAAVEVYSGYPLPGVDEYALWVYRSGSDADTYSLSGGIVDVTHTWQVACIVRAGGLGPDEVERRLSLLVGNVLLNLWRHRHNQDDEDGYRLWMVAETMPHQVVNVRTADGAQSWEMETIPYRLRYQLQLET